MLTPIRSRFLDHLLRPLRNAPAEPGRFPAWIPLWALLLACLYLPTLGTRFDFIDDGNLVYPAPPIPLGQRLGLVWEKVVANYEHLGPFRPVLWVHWEAEAELFRANPVAWRAGRLLWAALAEHLAELTRRADEGARVLVLRLKRARNPDMVCLEHLQRFLTDMQARKVTMLLCGVREDFAQALRNLDFYRWLPPECVFLEDGAVGSSTLQAVRRAYELLGTDLSETCPRRHEKGPRSSRTGTT